jgi:hypothetical protein
VVRSELSSIDVFLKVQHNRARDSFRHRAICTALDLCAGTFAGAGNAGTTAVGTIAQATELGRDGKRAAGGLK